MKKLLFICVVLLTFKSLAQNPELKGSYRFTENGLKQFSSQKNNTDTVEIKKNSKITVWNYDDSSKLVYYKYWDYNDSVSIKNEKTKKVNPLAKEYNDQIFTMPYSNFIRITEPVYNRYKGCAVGAYTIPFRLRGTGSDFDFESSLSLQSNIVFGFGTRNNSESWIDLSAGIGLTGVNLNSKNSDVLEDRTATAFTASLGTVFKFNRWANMGLFLGYDWLGAKDRNVNWKYNGDLWIGLGINISFNSIKTDDNSFTRDKRQ